MIAALVSGALHANLAMAAGVAAVALARKPVRRAFGARAAYALWLAVPLAGAAVLAPRPQAPTPLTPVMDGAVAAFEATPVAVGPSFDWSLVAFTVWALGVVAAAALLAVRQARFMGEVRAGRAGPAVVGALRPRIVTPADFEARFGPDERAMILSHEAAHLAAGDARVNAAAAALQCLNWFNPLVHVGCHLMRIDQELACDAAVLARHPQARRLYAEALLKTQLTTQALPLGCHWPSAAEHPLKERIAMLKSPLPRGLRRLAGLAVVATAAAGAGLAGWAAQPSPAKLDGPLIAQPVWLQKPTGADIARLYPAEARRLATDMRIQALLTCRVANDGRLTNCTSTSDQVTYGALTLPKGGTDFGIPGALLQLSKSFRMAPVSRDGVKTAGAWVKIPVLWRNDGSALLANGDVRADAPPTIERPVWIEKPTGEQIARLYPVQLLDRGVSAMVLLTCRVGADGRLDLCAVGRSEAQGPEGRAPDADMDFGTASLQLAKLFRMDVTTKAGTVGGIVRIPVKWVPHPVS